MAVYMLDLSTVLVQMYCINLLATKTFTRTKISKKNSKNYSEWTHCPTMQNLFHILGLQTEQLY